MDLWIHFCHYRCDCTHQGESFVRYYIHIQGDLDVVYFRTSEGAWQKPWTLVSALLLGWLVPKWAVVIDLQFSLHTPPHVDLSLNCHIIYFIFRSQTFVNSSQRAPTQPPTPYNKPQLLLAPSHHKRNHEVHQSSPHHHPTIVFHSGGCGWCVLTSYICFTTKWWCGE